MSARTGNVCKNHTQEHTPINRPNPSPPQVDRVLLAKNGSENDDKQRRHANSGHEPPVPGPGTALFAVESARWFRQRGPSLNPHDGARSSQILELGQLRSVRGGAVREHPYRLHRLVQRVVHLFVLLQRDDGEISLGVSVLVDVNLMGVKE